MTMSLIIGIVVLLAVLLVIAMVFASREGQESEKEVQKFPYKLKQYFFTKSEQEFLRILELKIDHLKFTVFPKVRMGDYVEVALSDGERMPPWSRIRSRHVDFILWSIEKNAIVAAIELDGNSRNTHKAQKNDAFKDEVFKSIGIPLHRVRVGTSFEQAIDQIVTNL